MPTHKQYVFSMAVWRGATYEAAAREAGYSERTDPSHIAANCRKAGLLPNPEDLKVSTRELMQHARERAIAYLDNHLDEILEALVEAGESGNVPAMREVLDRLMGKPAQDIDVTTGGRPLTADEFNRQVEVLKQVLADTILNRDLSGVTPSQLLAEVGEALDARAFSE